MGYALMVHQDDPQEVTLYLGHHEKFDIWNWYTKQGKGNGPTMLQGTKQTQHHQVVPVRKNVSKPNFRQTVSTEQAYAKTTYTTTINTKKRKTKPSIQQQQTRVSISAGLTLYFDQHFVLIPRNLFWFKTSFGDDFNQRFYSALFCCSCSILVGLKNWGWYPTRGWKMPRTSSRTSWSPCFGMRPRPPWSPSVTHVDVT